MFEGMVPARGDLISLWLRVFANARTSATGRLLQRGVTASIPLRLCTLRCLLACGWKDNE
eukprot:628727-Amphidinium_carterae.1